MNWSVTAFRGKKVGLGPAPPRHFPLKSIKKKGKSAELGKGRPGSGRVSSLIYVGDAIWVANSVGSRLSGSVEARGWDCKRLLNEVPSNKIKADLEGQCVAKVLVLVFFLIPMRIGFPRRNLRLWPRSICYVRMNLHHVTLYYAWRLYRNFAVSASIGRTSPHSGK